MFDDLMADWQPIRVEDVLFYSEYRSSYLRALTVLEHIILRRLETRRKIL